jgi:phage terminase large subunit
LYVIKSDREISEYTPRGAAEDFIYSRDPEIIIVGPAETGKTIAACWKLHTIMTKYSGIQSAIIRKSYKSMPGSVLQTFGKIIKGSPVQIYGGERPEKYIYPNGSIIWVGGMDNPDKVLSSERDIIYVNQAEELEQGEWETLTTRVTGRAGNLPYSQLCGDCNPAGSQHWIRQRAKDGKLKLLFSKHQDNPTLYTDDGKLTERGKRTMSTLQSLSGVRYKRLFLGEWATAEGAVYEMFNRNNHVLVRDSSEFVYWGLAIDEGYTNPAVILLIGTDSDGRKHIFQEFYERGKLQSDVVAAAQEMAAGKNVTEIAVDASAAGLIADLRNVGLPAVPQKGRVLDGIHVVQEHLKVRGDGRPYLTVDPSCVNTINEFESYVWKPRKDEPVKEMDHAMDALRYYLAGNLPDDERIVTYDERVNISPF